MELFVPGPVGPLEASLWTPRGRKPAAVCVLGHPHPLRGGTMHSTVVFRTGKGLLAAGVAVLRFQFRGVGRSGGCFDGHGGEHADFRAVLGAAAERFPGLPRWAGGFSFGAEAAVAVAAAGEALSRLVLVGLPVLAFDCSAIERARVPGVLLQGERDEFGTLADLAARHPGIDPRIELIEIPGADHFFRSRERELGERVRGIAERWLGAGPPSEPRPGAAPSGARRDALDPDPHSNGPR